MYLRKEVVGLLISLDKRVKAAEKMIKINNFCGFRNQMIIENIKLIEDFDLHEALPYLQELAQDISPFKMTLASRARQAIDKFKDKHGNQ